jgi:hypothetical protein
MSISNSKEINENITYFNFIIVRADIQHTSECQELNAFEQYSIVAKSYRNPLHCRVDEVDNICDNSRESSRPHRCRIIIILSRQ